MANVAAAQKIEIFMRKLPETGGARRPAPTLDEDLGVPDANRGIPALAACGVNRLDCELLPAVGTNAAIAMKRASARSPGSSEMMKATVVPVQV